MRQCEMKMTTGQQCPNEAFANIGITGDKGSVRMDVCKAHLDQLTATRPTVESPIAKRQREERG